ncbi:DNA polymerase I [Rubrobacter calidifluminis]|uniref:DNA polymerase I n=1 Tax=Rubrobacter calidifluminis TaxID=1392640 RepID=UPI002362A6F8|nr:DNA polymerase I [Rubrobacter calidifluminis]
MRLYLIDGYSLLYRAFYALPQSISTREGLMTNALYGFTSVLLKILGEEGEKGVAVVWDGGLPSSRTGLYEGYKAQRKPMPEELKDQLEHLDDILRAMNVPVVRVEGHEADDVIATLSRRVPEGSELMIVTGDQDAMQLVDGNVRVMRTSSRSGFSETKVYGREEVVEEYGVTPEQIPDYKALTGDPSDNIPGVRGIGPKSASKLLQRFGSLEGIYEHLDEVSPEGTRRKLEEGRESAFMSLELARMHFDVPVDFDLEGLRFEGVAPECREVFERYEFNSFLERRLPELPVAGGGRVEAPRRRRVRIAGEPSEPSLDPVAVAPVGDGRWAVATAGDEAYVSGELPAGQLWVHDAKGCGVRRASFDTYLAAYLIQPGTRSYEPETLARERGLEEVEVEHEDPEVAGAARRAALVYALVPGLRDELEEMELSRLYYEVELPLADVLAKMERVGMPVDVGTLEEVGREIEGRISELEARIFEEVGHPFNISSPKQLGEVLFEELSIPPVRKTKTGYSTDAKVLQQLALQGYTVAGRVIEYRELTKLRGTYVEALSRLVGEDGRIHTTLNQTTTATGRISSDSPNLQNIPVRTELGARIRDAFTASEGRVLLVCDYSQIELRILAHMTREPALVEAFRSGEDIHTRTASEVFDVRPESVTPELRRRAKMVNFGILYGISGYGLATRLGNVHPSEAERYIKRYLERYPRVSEFIRKTNEEARELGYTTTLFGRRRYVPELRSKNKSVQRLGERLAFNARVQGTAADIIKIAMVDIDGRLPEGVDMIMQVHDELVFDVERDLVGEVAALAAARMVAACELDPPLEVEIKSGERWGSVAPLFLQKSDRMS